MTNVLYLADIHPKSHNLKWIGHFAKAPNYKVFVLPLTQQLKENSINNLPKSIQVVGSNRPYSLWKIWNVISDVFLIRRIIKKYKINIIHIMYAEPNAHWVLWKFFLKKPFVLTTRGTDILKTINGFSQTRSLVSKAAFFMYKKAFTKFDKITSTSQGQIDLINKWCPAADVDLIRTGVDLDRIKLFLNQGHQEVRNKIDGDYILFPRSIYPLYNHELSLEAIRELPSEIKGNYKFVFLGSETDDTAYLDRLKSISNNWKLPVVFLETQTGNEYFDLLFRASLIVMNPKSDGSPVTAMESMYLKKPIILPPLDYDADIFDDSVFKFSDWNSQSLSKLIVEVLNMNEDILESRLNAGKNNICKMADFDKEVFKVEKLYESIR